MKLSERVKKIQPSATLEVITKVAKMKEKGYTIVPLRIFFSEKNLIKIEIGLGKGKKLYDKRESIKQRETTRQIKRKYGI